jgi:capsular polysaccharide export protein
MDGMSARREPAVARSDALPPVQRSVLFLQGPISDFFDGLGRALIARGHTVHRINLHLGDQLFWRLPAVNFRGRFDEWRSFIGEFLERQEITDVIVHGDRRPHHIIAAEEARARGIAVMATDLGYVRPDWITLEYDGMSSYSRFPRDPEAIRELAAMLPPVDIARRFPAVSFAWTAMLDVAYNVAQVLGRPLYPHYRWHGIFHPYTEYAGWIVTLARHRLTHARTIAAKVRLEADPKSYFLFPLQLATDYQLRAHSPFTDARDAVRRVVESFAASGSRRKLVLIVHPLDNGLIGWQGLALKAARQFGAADRVVVLRDGTPLEVLRRAAGVVTINSTVGLTALIEGVPVKVLGNAVFDVPGLTCQEDLDGFWGDPVPPEPGLMQAFLRALVGATQVRGGYYERESKARAIAGFVERIEEGLFPLPSLSPADLVRRKIRESTVGIAVLGAARGIGRALARDYAAPGVSLFLAGEPEADLAAVAEDCRRRGAIVEVYTDRTGIERALAAFDCANPVELLIAPDATAPIDTAVEQMRQRRRGRIALVTALDRRHGVADLIGAKSRAETLGVDAEELRQRLNGSGLSVAVVRPGRFASRMAGRLAAAQIVEVGADRAARLIRRGLERGAEEIAIPSSLAAARRALPLLPVMVRGWARRIFLPARDAVVTEADETPLRSETGAGN